METLIQDGSVGETQENPVQDSSSYMGFACDESLNHEDKISPMVEDGENLIADTPVSRVFDWEKKLEQDEKISSSHVETQENPVQDSSSHTGFPCDESFTQEDKISQMVEDEETLIADPSVSRVFDWEKKLEQDEKISTMEKDEESSFDYMVCDSGSRLVTNGFMRSNCTEDVVIFVNAGGEALVEEESNISFLSDQFFQGGDMFQTNECITESGDFPFIYQSARVGDFSYHFDALLPGHYHVDLHFVEMINTYGPKGMRVFDVYIQDEKVLADFDIFSVVGANKPLQLVDLRVSVKNTEGIVIRFEGINGSPVVSGICIRKAPKVSDTEIKHDHLLCQNCSSEIEVPSAQKKAMRLKSVAKYEQRIHDLSTQCQRKSDECYQAWMSLSAANAQLEKLQMDLDNKLFQTYSLDQNMAKQSEKLRDISSRYEHDKKTWIVAINDLDQKIKVMKQEQSQMSLEAHRCADSVPELNKMVFAVQALVAQCEDLKVKYSEEQAKRRKLHNQVQEAKGNIRVFCRCRPLNKSEVSIGCSTVVDFESANDGELVVNGSTKKSFKFDRVYSPKDNQVDVFADAAPMVTSVLDGYNVCIFAYGQTGTGKTFTMEGTEENRGVNYRTLEELFKIAKERSETFTYSISVSVLEVYNEQIRDLLATPSSLSKKLEVKQASEGLHHIPGIVEAKVENTKEVWNVLQAGSSARAVGSNNVNEHSSRSHCMLCILVKAKNLMNGECTKSKLWLVDLAGSERLAKTDVQGDRLKEAQNINRSLSALGDVISALANKSSHIPYRNSKLTHLLQDSLGGDSKTLMFVQISPSEQDLSETLSSLNFAARVRGIELGPARKQIDTGELQKIKTMLDKARHECRSKDESIRKLEESLQNLEGKAKGKDQVYKNQQEKIKDLEGQIELKMVSHSQSEKQISNLSERLKGKEEANTGLQQKVKEIESKLREREQLETTSYQQKVRDLEDKLKAQIQESKSQSLILHHKVEELEKKLKEEQEKNSDSCLLRQKIKELEKKIKEQELQLSSAQIMDFTNSARSTPQLSSAQIMDTTNSARSRPFETKHLRDEFMSEAEEQHILKNSNSINREVMSQGSSLVKRNDPSALHDIRRKRLSRNSETENTVVSTTLYEVRKKRLSRNSETENNFVSNTVHENKGRKSDPPKPFMRTTRTTVKPVGTTTTTAQRPAVPGSRTSNPVLGIKERENKKRLWSR